MTYSYEVNHQYSRLFFTDTKFQILLLNFEGEFLWLPRTADSGKTPQIQTCKAYFPENQKKK